MDAEVTTPVAATPTAKEGNTGQGKIVTHGESCITLVSLLSANKVSPFTPMATPVPPGMILTESGPKQIILVPVYAPGVSPNTVATGNPTRKSPKVSSICPRAICTTQQSIGISNERHLV